MWEPYGEHMWSYGKPIGKAVESRGKQGKAGESIVMWEPYGEHMWSYGKPIGKAWESMGKQGKAWESIVMWEPYGEHTGSFGQKGAPVRLFDMQTPRRPQSDPKVTPK